jgi:hypothetical protein
LKRDQEKHAPYYHSEVRVRVLLTLLKDHAPVHEKLDQVTFDLMLKNMFTPGEFIWEQELAPGFPEDEFWYLYGEV